MTDPFGVPERDLESDHLVETPDSLRDDDLEAVPLDRGREPGERPAASESFGTTHAEEAAGEDLDHRLMQEEPEIGAAPGQASSDSLGEDVADEDLVWSDGDQQQVGRLVEPDEGAHPDTEKEAVATDVGTDAGNPSAEEAAMHVEAE